MGRIRPTYIKRAARMLVERYPDKFSSDYKQNRRALEELASINSKLLKNKIAGYIATLLEQRAREG
jgi:small subunit ribosomal protein S17e